MTVQATMQKIGNQISRKENLKDMSRIVNPPNIKQLEKFPLSGITITWALPDSNKPLTTPAYAVECSQRNVITYLPKILEAQSFLRGLSEY